MPENIGGPLSPFNTQIPSISDDADIQTAFRLYHYGSNTSTPSSIPENSIAGHFTSLDAKKLGLVPSPIPTSADLNSFVTTGFYAQADTPTGPNYPAPFAGLLTVTNNGSTVFQQYQAIGATESGVTANPINKTYWRFKIGTSAFRPWRTFIDGSSFAAEGDPRYVQGTGSPTFISNYYTKSEINAFLAPVPSTYLTIAEADARSFITENLQTESYTLQLSDRNKVVAMNNAASAVVTVPTNASVAFPIGSIVNVYAMSNQTINIAGASGVTVRNAGRLFERYVEISLRKRATDEWVASGNIIPV
jgi:hypothetical protein